MLQNILINITYYCLGFCRQRADHESIRFIHNTKQQYGTFLKHSEKAYVPITIQRHQTIIAQGQGYWYLSEYKKSTGTQIDKIDSFTM